jgi:hypothetical protein
MFYMRRSYDVRKHTLSLRLHGTSGKILARGKTLDVPWILSRLRSTLRIYALDIPFVRLDLACHQYHPSQLLVPHLHEFPALVQHWNDPEKMRPAHPLNQIYPYSLPFRFLGEEDCFLVSWVLSRSSNVDWWKKLDVWMEQRRVKWIVNPRRSVPCYQPR